MRSNRQSFLAWRGIRADGRPGLAVPLSLVLLASTASAQTPPRFLVSTSDDLVAPVAVDSDLLAIGGGQAASVYFSDGHWLATVGFEPSDIDAFAFRPLARKGTSSSFAFSLLSDEGGVEDGDVLGIAAAGGVEVLTKEDDLASALGLPGTALDVDALAFDDLGQLFFSLQSDLANTTLGQVLDGDVLFLKNDGNVDRWLSEGEVETRFIMATGSTSSITDVLGIEWVNGEIWASVQAPSAYDGAIFSCGSAPALVLDEVAAGLGGEELDAFALAPTGSIVSNLQVASTLVPAGSTVHADLYGRPGSLQLVFMAGNAGTYPFGQVPGFGGFFVDPLDPWLLATILGPHTPIVQLDAAGVYAIDYLIPPDMVWGAGFGGEEGWSFQMIDGGTFEVSTPVRIARL